MRNAPNDIITGTRHMSNNFGELEVVEYVDALNVRVKFLATGYETIALADMIRRGGVKDRLAPSVCGVGYVGEGRFKPSIDGKQTKIYSTWSSMITRCYNKNNQTRQPTYIGCSVCEEWHNFQNFAKWMNEMDYEGKQLDKDIKIKGNKVYSPNTCMFVSHSENLVEARAKQYILVSPDGVRVEVYNLSEFCRENELCQSHMSNVHSGKAIQHKGWTAYKSI